MARLTKTKIRERMNRIYGIDDIQSLSNLTGYFFAKDTMIFFSCRKLEGIHKIDKRGGEQRVLFLTSEKKCFNDSTRVYSVNVFNPENYAVETWRKSKFSSSKKARRFAENCAINQSIVDNGGDLD